MPSNPVHQSKRSGIVSTKISPMNLIRTSQRFQSLQIPHKGKATRFKSMAGSNSMDLVLKFWFGDEFPNNVKFNGFWFQKSDEFDRKVENKFGGTVQDAIAGRLDQWAEDGPKGRLALILCLDQFTRNIYRDTPTMYSGDEKAIKLAREISMEDIKKFSIYEKAFSFMPLMHSEDLKDQELGVSRFAEMKDKTVGTDAFAQADNFHKFMVQHRDIVYKYGRFPHRNKVLGRDSTPEEIEFLQKPGSSF